MSGVPELVDALAGGDRRTLARLLSALEDGAPAGRDVVAALRASPGRRQADVLAFTGPPGVGKSTLVASIAKLASDDGRTVAVLAVDPSSHLTGGAVLGDRIRMTGVVGPEVYIRSFANRGVVGGLARVVPDAIEIVGAAGYDLIVVETVGVGQSEIEVTRHADVTAVVLAPFLGDEIQAVKAGVMEIADVFVVNKCDLPEAGRAVGNLRATLRLRHVGRRDVPVLKASASTGDRVRETWDMLAELLRDAAGGPARAAREEASRAAAFGEALADAVRTADAPEGSLLRDVLDGAVAPADAADRVARWLREELS
jgi:LAO/AO transport system kinase